MSWSINRAFFQRCGQHPMKRQTFASQKSQSSPKFSRLRSVTLPLETTVSCTLALSLLLLLLLIINISSSTSVHCISCLHIRNVRWSHQLFDLDLDFCFLLLTACSLNSADSPSRLLSFRPMEHMPSTPTPYFSTLSTIPSLFQKVFTSTVHIPWRQMPA